MDEIWYPGSEKRPWFALDQKAINEGRTMFYNDQLHFVGPLTVASLTQILNMVCPSGGKIDTTHLMPYVGFVVRNQSDDQLQYVVDPAGQLRPLPGQCRDVLQAKVVTLKASAIRNIQMADALPRAFCDVDRLYQVPNDRSVYVLQADHKLHVFDSGSAFLSRGYSFDKVDKIERWQMDLFAVGDSLH